MNWLTRFLFLFVLILVIVVFAFAFTYSELVKEWGGWGDWVGGTLNPILTFCTFVAILISIHLQRLDLVETRKELVRSADALEAQIGSITAQNFESSFFQMVNAYNSIVAGISMPDGNGGEINGRACFQRFTARFFRQYQESLENGPNADSLEHIVELYEGFYKSNQQDLGHYFRLLYNIFRYLESDESKDIHVNIIRSMISDHELVLLFYNCASQKGAKFARLANKFEIFDNLPTEEIFSPLHLRLLDESAFGSNPMTLPGK